MVGLKLNKYMSNFQPHHHEAVCRGSEPQLQVGEYLFNL